MLDSAEAEIDRLQQEKHPEDWENRTSAFKSLREHLLMQRDLYEVLLGDDSPDKVQFAKDFCHLKIAQAEQSFAAFFDSTEFRVDGCGNLFDWVRQGYEEEVSRMQGFLRAIEKKHPSSILPQ